MSAARTLCIALYYAGPIESTELIGSHGERQPNPHLARHGSIPKLDRRTVRLAPAASTPVSHFSSSSSAKTERFWSSARDGRRRAPRSPPRTVDS
jgi:hypothetical protein